MLNQSRSTRAGHVIEKYTWSTQFDYHLVINISIVVSEWS